jgi:hypothetical protein
MKKIAITLIFVFALMPTAGAQKKMKPWTEWNEKEVNKMLNDSAWGQTQNETNTSEMFYSPTNQGGARSTGVGGSSNDRNSQGALNQATNIAYSIRLLSAKPIRQAFARRVMMQNPQMAEQLKAFADRQSDQYIVVAVDYNSADRRLSGPAMQQFNSANLATLKNTTYLETKDGKRVFLEQYMAPINDGMGAKFIFPRMADGKPFVTKDSGFLRFYSEFTGSSSTLKLNMRFKISDMTYEEKLEY